MAPIKGKKQRKGLELNSFSISTMIAASILIIGALAATFSMSEYYRRINDDTVDYTELESQAEIVEEASDYLTEQVRLFVVTADLRHAQLYFEEANITRRRENALAVLANHRLADDWAGRMEAAVAVSQELMEQEIYAMKLVAEAMGYRSNDLPQEVQEVQLADSDIDLKPPAKIEKAQELVFGADYRRMKAVIYEHLSYYTEGVLLATKNNLMEELDTLSSIISIQRLLLFGLLGIIILTFVVIRRFIVDPLRAQCKAMEERQPLRALGAYELQCLAYAYRARLNALHVAKREQEGMLQADTPAARGGGEEDGHE